MPQGIKIILKNSRLFAAFDDQQLETVLEHGSLKKHPAGKTIVKEGQRDHGLYFIVSGQVEIILPPERGRLSKVSLCTLSEGEYFGEYSLLDNEPASASAVTKGPCEIFTVPRGQFDALTRRDDALSAKLYRNMLLELVSRARKTNQELDIVFG